MFDPKTGELDLSLTEVVVKRSKHPSDTLNLGGGDLTDFFLVADVIFIERRELWSWASKRILDLGSTGNVAGKSSQGRKRGQGFRVLNSSIISKVKTS